ncbi:hypothetical protein GCM10023080_093790 [Streptomyces pseudoechinosporeus]
MVPKQMLLQLGPGAVWTVGDNADTFALSLWQEKALVAAKKAFNQLGVRLAEQKRTEPSHKPTGRVSHIGPATSSTTRHTPGHMRIPYQASRNTFFQPTRNPSVMRLKSRA